MKMKMKRKKGCSVKRSKEEEKKWREVEGGVEWSGVEGAHSIDKGGSEGIGVEIEEMERVGGENGVARVLLHGCCVGEKDGGGQEVQRRRDGAMARQQIGKGTGSGSAQRRGRPWPVQGASTG